MTFCVRDYCGAYRVEATHPADTPRLCGRCYRKARECLRRQQEYADERCENPECGCHTLERLRRFGR